MTDAWNMTGGNVYVAPAGADPKDPSQWHEFGTLSEIETRYEDGWCTSKLTIVEPVSPPKPKPAKVTPRTIAIKHYDPEVLKLYYGTDVPKFAGINNRGGARKEEKHMGVRKFESSHEGTHLRIEGDRVGRTTAGSGVYMKLRGDGFGWFSKADVPLIAHALFEKSGWPDAVKDGFDSYRARIDGRDGISWPVASDKDANKALTEAIANLAAYNAWHEGAAEREAAEAAKKAEAEEAARKKREHDELRTSPIALEALALYNETSGTKYESWDAVNYGKGADDDTVRYWIAKAEAARAAKPAPKVGDRVRVSAEGVRACGAFAFDGEVDGIVVAEEDCVGDIKVKASTAERPGGVSQYIKPKYVTVLATAEDLAAEKAKAERDANIEKIATVTGDPRRVASYYYDRGLRATA